MSGPKRRPMLERFWEKVVKDKDGCWLYCGRMAKPKYRFIAIGGGGSKMVLAHRYSYQIHHGEIGEGLYICHKCDVRNCVNPDHLYAGTHEQNTQDNKDRNNYGAGVKRVIKQRPIRSVYKHGRALSKDHQVQLRDEYATGKYTQTQLAYRFNITQSTVSAIVNCYPRQANPTGGKKRSGFFRRKMDPRLYQEIRDAYATGNVTQTELAKRFNCTQTHISRIVHKADPQE